MGNTVQKLHSLVCDLREYRDGTLPLAKQEFHQPMIEILRCSHWLLQVWSHSNLSAPYWRLYWNEDPGAVVRLAGKNYSLGPESLLLIAPNTPFRTFLSAPIPQAAQRQPHQEDENLLIGCPMDQTMAAAVLQLHERTGTGGEDGGRGRGTGAGGEGV